MKKIPVLLDTDIGTDIDDALALAYLLRQPRCELVGVTTVAKNAKRRASLCDMLCKIAGRSDVPIHSGSDDPIITSLAKPTVEQARVLAEYEHRTDFPDNSAVEFMAKTIMSRPGEITLLTIGALTNAALLFATYPQTRSMLKSVMIMGGMYSSRLAGTYWPEYNIACDPHAAAVVFNTGPVVTIGTDVTFECKLLKKDCGQLWTNELMVAVSKMAGVWFERAPHIVFHDPLTAACIFDESICKWTDGNIEVDLSCGRAMGYTYFDAGKEPNHHKVASGVDVAKFFEHYRSIVLL